MTIKMLGEIAVLCGKICFVNKTDHRTLDIVLYEYSKSSNGSNFVQKQNFLKKFESHQKIRWHGITVVGDWQTNLKVLVLLVQVDNGECFVFSLENQCSKIKLLEIGTLNSNFKSKLVSNVNIFCNDGPSVLFCEEATCITLFSTTHKKSTNFDLLSYFENMSTVSKILWFSTYNGIALDTEIFLVILKLTSEKNSIKIFAIVSEKIDDKVENKLLTLNTHLFFTSYYESVVSAVYIQILQNMENFTTENPMEEFVENNYTVISTNKQFLMFNSGSLKYICNLPLPNVERIIVFPMRCSNFEKLKFFLKSSKNICSVEVCKDTNEIKSSEVWSAVQVLSGGFQKTYDPQILLISDIEFDSWQYNYKFLELSSQSVFTDSKKQDIPLQYLKNAVEGMQKKVTLEKASIVDAEYSIAEKNAAIFDILDRLNNRCDNQLPQSTHNQSSLFDIILSTDEAQEKNKPEIMKNLPLALCIIDQWKYTYPNHCVFGWTLKNISECCVKNLNVIIAEEEDEIEYRQKNFINSMHFSLNKPERNHVVYSELYSVGVCITIPDFVSDSIELTCILMWNIGVSEKWNTNEIFSRNNPPSQQLISKVTLSAKEILKKRPDKACTKIQELMSFRITQESLMVDILSTNSSLSNFETFFCRKNLPQPDIVPLEIKSAIFSEKDSPLYGVNFHWNQINMKTLEAEIFVRNSTEAMLLIHWLYIIFPCDVSIVPKASSKEETNETRKRILIAMKEEVDLIRAAFETSNKTAEQEKQINRADCDIEIVDEQEKTCNLDRKEAMMSREEFLRFRQSLAKHEVLTDKLAQFLS